MSGSTGEGLKSLSRLDEEAANERMEEARARAEQVLGKGVHPAAVERLFEVWPEAQVAVAHERELRAHSYTYVEVWIGNKSARDKPHGLHVTRNAKCHPDDQFNRRTGVRIAFDRCLREVVRRAEPERLLTGRRKR